VLKFLNFRYQGNKGRSEDKLKVTFKWANPVNDWFGARISDITVIHVKLYWSSDDIPKFLLP